MNVKSITRAAVLGGAVAFAALAGGTVQSQAAGLGGLSAFNAETAQSEVQQVGFKKKQFRKFGFNKSFKFKKRRFGFRKFSSNKYGGQCGFFKREWKRTGSFFWKKKFFTCKGWW